MDTNNDQNDNLDQLLTSDPLSSQDVDTESSEAPVTPIPEIEDSSIDTPAVPEQSATMPTDETPQSAPPTPPTVVTPTSVSPTSNTVAEPISEPEVPAPPTPTVPSDVQTASVASSPPDIQTPVQQDSDYSTLDKEAARQKANELMDKGKFAEAAQLLKSSGNYQPVTPKPQAATPTEQVPKPPSQPEEIPSIPPVSSEPIEPTPIIKPEPTPPPAAGEVPPPSGQIPLTTVVPPAPEIPTPSKSEVVSETQDPDLYLKKAYDLRQALIEYDRRGVSEHEKLQQAEDLIFAGNNDEAIRIYKEVAIEAEENKETEVAIEAYERLAAILR